MYGYLAFCVANREEVKAANPAAEFGDMGRLLRTRWNMLSESEKAMYDKPRVTIQMDLPDQGVRQSSRLRNKRLGLNFWGLKEKKLSEKSKCVEPQIKVQKDLPVQGVRQSSRLRNKRLGLNFWGLKEKK